MQSSSHGSTTTADNRLQALGKYRIVNTSSELFFKSVVESTARIFNAKLGLISFVNESDVFYKEVVGADFEGVSVPVSQSPCAYAIHNNEVTVLDRYPSDSHPSWEAYHFQVTNFGLRFYAGAPIQTKDGYNIGMIALVDEDPRIFTQRDCDILKGQAKMIMDELELRLKSIQENEEWLKAIFEQASIGICLCSYTGDFIKVNQRFSEIVGHSIPDLLTKNFSDISYREDRNQIAPSIAHLISGDVGSVTLEKKLVRPSGEITWVQTTISLLRDSGGRPAELLVMVEDINDKKEARDKILQQNEHLASLTNSLIKKNSQLEEYTQIVSHNLRMPTGNIVLLLEQIDKWKDDKDELDVFLKYLRRTGRQLLSTLDYLNEELKVKEEILQEKKQLHFKEAVEKVRQLYFNQILESEAIIISDFTDAPSIIYPEIYLDSILACMVNNALKYRSPDRRLEIRFETRIIKDAIILDVTDNGLGIDLEKHGHQIFKFGKTFHANKDNKGFSLFLIKSRVQAMGGDISVKSKLNEGTTFSINFTPPI